MLHLLMLHLHIPLEPCPGKSSFLPAGRNKHFDDGTPASGPTKLQCWVMGRVPLGKGAVG